MIVFSTILIRFPTILWHIMKNKLQKSNSVPTILSRENTITLENKNQNFILFISIDT